MERTDARAPVGLRSAHRREEAPLSDSAFRLWRSAYVEGYCVIGTPAGVPRGHELALGVSRAAGWPSGLRCRMREEYPTDRLLPDSFFGLAWVVVSARARALLEERGGPRVEYLPVGVEDHEGRLAADDCAVVNPLAVVDAIDVEASGVTWNPIRKTLISACRRLVVDPSRVPPELGLFRLTHLEHTVVVRTELARRLSDAGLVGLAWVDPADFVGG